MKTLITVTVTALVCAARAEISVTVSPPKIVGQKADIPMQIENSLDKKVESVRAVTFLLDANGKVVAKATRWIIGDGGSGKSTSSIPAKSTRNVHFVVSSDKPFATTNLTAKVSFIRVVLEGGTLADVNKDVQIRNP